MHSEFDHDELNPSDGKYGIRNNESQYVEKGILNNIERLPVEIFGFKVLIE